WRGLTLLAATTGTCLAAWLLPRSKPAAVAGRLNYAQFMLALLAAGLVVTVALVALRPAGRRRVAVFRAAALWLGAAVALLAWEGAAFFWPARHAMDNPWYLFSGEGVSASDELPFERPAHLRWKGLSRGDLAILNQDDD